MCESITDVIYLNKLLLSAFRIQQENPKVGRRSVNMFFEIASLIFGNLSGELSKVLLYDIRYALCMLCISDIYLAISI